MDKGPQWDVTFDALQDAVMVLDPEGCILSCNRAAQEMFGVREDALGRPCWEVIHKSTKPVRDCPTVCAKRSLTRERREFRMGSRWFLADSHPLLDEEGRLTGIIHVVSDITEKKETEEAFRRSEERFRQAMEAARDGIWEWDVRTGKVYYSPAYAQMLGYEVSEFGDVVGAWIEHVHPEDRERALEVNRRCIENEVPHFEVEFRMRTKHGDWKWILGRGKAVKRDADGTALVMIGTHTDITQLKLSQEKLLVQSWIGAALATITRMEEGLGLILDAVVHVTGLDCGAVFFLKEEPERLVMIHQVGLPAPVAQAMQSPDGVRAMCRLVQAGGACYAAHERLDVPGAGVAQAEGLQAAAVVPIRYEHRVVGCLYVASRSGTDISRENQRFLESVAAQMGNAYGRVEARRRLDESLKQYRTLFEVAGDAFFVVRRADGCIMDANQAASKLLEIARGELIGRPWTHLWAGDQRLEEWVRNLESAEASGPIFVQARLTTRSGEAVPVEISASPFDLNGHRVIYISARDIRERLRAERERRALEEQLRQAQKMESVGRLAGGIAHDFNNLLTPILGYAEMLTSVVQEAELCTTYARSIRDAALKAKDLIGKLLAFSRRQVLDMRPVDLRAALEDLQAMLRRTIRENIEIQMSLPQEPVVVKADVRQMEQVLVNLVVNAQDAMPSGGTLAVQLESREFLEESEIPAPDLAPGRYAVLTVADTGTGMDRRTLERIFEPFFTTKAEGKGTGLGLSTVYGIVEQHEGRILATSIPGMGSAFEIYLPQLEGTAAYREPDDAESPPVVRGKGETILLVEDDDMVRELTYSMLQSLGYHVLEAASPSHALQRVEALREPPAALLTDMVLPEMTGKDLFGILRKKWPELKVLYMSGYPEKIEAGEAPDRGGLAFLPKPFSMAQLSRKLAAVLEG